MKKLLVFVLAAVMVLSLAACGGNKSKYEWPQTELGNMLPTPTNPIEFLMDYKDSLSARVADVTSEDFRQYLNGCKDKGFTVEAEETSDSYDAFNESGYKLRLQLFSNEDLSIDLDAPKKMGEFVWPDSDAGKLIPQTKSTYGTVEKEYEGGFTLYVGKMSKADFDEYVQACKNAGFSADYRKTDTVFRAENEEGSSLRIEYTGFDTVYIRLDPPEKEISSEASSSAANPYSDKVSEAIDEWKDKVSEAVDDINSRVSEYVDGLTSAPVETSTTEAPTEPSSEKKDDGKIRDEIKKAIDSYEDFVDEYCKFMKSYDVSDFSALTEYLSLLQKEEEMTKDFDKLQEKDMNQAELDYYNDVSLRCAKKLLDVAAGMN